ncbi:MAG: hypothetical protein AAF682_13145 [Planctomycetota bacterium]
MTCTPPALPSARSDLRWRRAAPAALALLLAAAPGLSAQGSQLFEETFDGLGLDAPTPLDSLRWDAVVHSRAKEYWLTFEPMQAAHGLDAAPPPATHTIDAYEDAVYLAKEHLMTAINSESYGLIYLTPNALADWSEGECVIRFDVSTLRTSRRDWIDVWLTPWDDHMILPLEEELPDLQGNPRRGLQLRMETWNTFYGGEQVDWSHFEAFRYDDYAETAYPVNVFGYELHTSPSPKKRETFELRVSRTHLKFGLPEYDLWWIDMDVEDLGYDRAVLQFGHHSYNPLKPGTLSPIAHDTSLAGVADPAANTWHWDAFEIAPTTRFDIIRADRRYVLGSEPETVTFERPAPAGSFLRFAAVGDAEVSFDGGPFAPATRQDGSQQVAGVHEDGFFSSFWMEVPEGTQTLDVRLTATGIWAFHGHETMAKDFALWSLPVGGTGCAGAGGVVPSAAHSTPALGDPSFSVDLADALPGATALLAVSFDEVETDACGIGVSFAPSSAPSLNVLQVGANGGATQGIPLPADPALLGVDVYAQWAVVDPAGAFGAVPGLPLALTPLRRIVLL